MITIGIQSIDTGTDCAIQDEQMNSVGATCFDIETGPLPDDQLRLLLPEFEVPPHPGEFDESAVLTGNAKDPKLIQAKIDKKRKEHEKAVEDYEQNVEKARKLHFEKFKEKAALDATTGRVVVIGAWARALGVEVIDGDERTIIETFWFHVTKRAKEHVPIIGFDIFRFDLPFLVRRSWILGIPVPPVVFSGDGTWRKWNSSLFIDVAAEWKFHNRTEFISLNTVGIAMGVGGKADGEVTGENFHKYWLSESQEDRAKALQYIETDVELPLKIAERMGLI